MRQQHVNALLLLIHTKVLYDRGRPWECRTLSAGLYSKELLKFTVCSQSIKVGGTNQ